jgi:hypothetical protein
VQDGVELDEEFRNAGANGQGLVMSRDGKRVAYLSFTGYPTLSYNIALFDLRDFERKPIQLSAKEIADCKRLALHPTAPLAASPGGQAIVLFDTRTGSVSAKQPQIPDELQGCAVHDFVFSGDGRRLVSAASRGGGERFITAIEVPSSSTSSRTK